MTDPAAEPRRADWLSAASTAGIAIVLMVLAGGVLAPYGRLILGGLYGVVERAFLHPFGIAVPGVVTLILVNLAILATSLAAGRRVGAIIAHRAVEGQLGSTRLLSAITWVAGAAGAAAYAASVPWAVVAGSGVPALAINATFGYLLHLVVLLVGPARGAARYLFTHPCCPRCWVWLELETGGGSFRLTDVPRIEEALAAQDLAALRDLPLADPSLPGASCSLHWWICPRCRARAFVTCSPGDPGDSTGAAIHSAHLAGPSVEDVRTLIAHRRALAHPGAPGPPPSAAARAS